MNRNVYRRLAVVACLVTWGVVGGAGRAETITCTGVCRFGPRDVLDNLEVKRGGVATVQGSLVKGNIVVEDGGVLVLKSRAAVNGDVQAFGAGSVTVHQATVGGSVQIKNTA